jgi:hypothetical protein
VLNKEELGHGHDVEMEASFWYYSFTRNSYANMMKEALYQARYDMKVDAITIQEGFTHDLEYLEKDLKFLKSSAIIHYNLVNYSLGDRDAKLSEFAIHLN